MRPLAALVRRPSRARLVTTAVVALAVIGLALRLYALGRQPVNSDETVVGLMAREILHGHFFAFYWGQDYGGGEPYVVALLFALFGQSSFTLGLAPVLLDALAALLIALIGCRLFPKRVALTAALLFWLWPEVFIWQSTLEYGFRWLALCCGLGVILCTLALLEAPRASQLRLVLLLGLLAGIGWWSTPEIAYFLAPCGLLVAYRLARRRVALSLLALAGGAGAALLGSLPWWWANLGSGFASLRSSPSPDPSWLSHLKQLTIHAAPIATGLQLAVNGRWLFGQSLGPLVALGVLALGCFWLLVLVVRGRASLLVLFVVLFPLLYALSPFTWYWLDDRYAVFVVPVIALLFAAGVDELARRYSKKAGGGHALVASSLLLVLALASTGWSLDHRSPFAPSRTAGSPSATWLTWRSDPTGYVARLAAAIEATGTRTLYAGYWVSYPLDFESHGRLVASDVRYDRYRPFFDVVRASRTAAWLFVKPADRAKALPYFGDSPLLDPGCAAGRDRCLDAREFERYLAAAHLSFVSDDLGDFTLVVPARPVDPVAVLVAFDIYPHPPKASVTGQLRS